MAELLGVIASAMSVVSLGIQVAESIQKLRAFYALIREAPTEILLLLDELETLSLILEDIDQNVQENVVLDPRTKSAVMKSYRLCMNCGDALRNLVKEVEEGLAKGRKRVGMKLALKKEKIEEIKKRLESSKATMLLANQCFNNAIQRQNWESHERDMVEIKVAMEGMSGMLMVVSNGKVEEPDDKQNNVPSKRSRLQLEETASSGSDHFTGYPQSTYEITTRQNGMKVLLGAVDLVLSQRSRTRTTTISFNLPAWIRARRYQFCFRSSYQGWDQTFRSYKVVSVDAPVFHYCMAGDVVALQQLFEDGQASPFEVDPEGRTPLHYAALYSRPQVCRFLLESGADVNIRTSWHGNLGQSWLSRDDDAYYPRELPIDGVFRALPAYSTPLHHLVTAGHPVADNRQTKSGSYTSFIPSTEEDFCETLKVLVHAGRSDIFHEDQFGQTALGAYNGPTKMFQWLKRHENVQISNLSAQEVQKHLVGQLTSPIWYDQIENLRQLIPEDGLTGDIAQSWGARFGNKHDSLFSVVTLMWIVCKITEEDDKRVIEAYEKLLGELITAGSELNSNSFGTTILLDLIHTIFDISTSESVLKSGVRSWLRVLFDAGVDLVEFGKIEHALHKNGQVDWTVVTEVHEDRFENRILDFIFGQTPEDFDIILEDFYVVGGLATDFWQLVEGDVVGNTDETTLIPGAWSNE